MQISNFGLHRFWWQVDIGDFILATILGFWWRNFDDIDYVTKTAKTVTNISMLSATHFVSNIVTNIDVANHFLRNAKK